EVIGPDGARLTYGDLAAEAATLTLPKPPALKDPSNWRILGKSQPRVELHEKVTGAPIYGIDVQLPDMLYATVAMSPHFGSKAKSADEAAAMAVPGVLNVVEIITNTGYGFGIIASNTWAAFEGARALAPEWEAASYPADTAGLKALWQGALDKDASFTLGGEGDPEAALEGAEVIEASYSLPYLAHTAMEPMNATAQFKDGKLTLWLGTQAPGMAAMVAADLLGIETDDVEVITTRLGGGFGRRIEVDAPLYAAAIAAQTGGKPVKVTWTREEDIQHDAYRPMAEARVKATLKNGLPEALDYRVAAPSITKSLLERTFPALGGGAGADRTILDGSFDQPFSWPHSRFAAHQIDTAIPVGFWRSVGHSINGFVHESFLDELAVAGGQDPLEMRLAMMKDERHAPGREVLKTVAEMAGWGQPLPEGVGQGIAHALSFGTWVAEVVQVDMRGGRVKIEKIWAVADPGMILDPGNFEAQITSGIIYGLSAAVGQEISFDDGRVVQENFYDYDALRMAGVPPIEVALLENSPRMGGAGEPGTPPVAAALGNAIFAASGRRLRALPFGKDVDFELG
ncbi:MAG TPA: xanthine dehydrogenase family protein molybdopterin-binding subunit, partial [Rhodobacteraceae bacterium]|nr:xanthine dehydrogenase family protein molybdopterin-binding subunit [Paracoccaceae bacterium]